MVESPGKSTRDDREERETISRARSSRKDGIGLETGRFGQRSSTSVHFFSHDDRQHHRHPLRLTTYYEHRQRIMFMTRE